MWIDNTQQRVLVAAMLTTIFLCALAALSGCQTVGGGSGGGGADYLYYDEIAEFVFEYLQSQGQFPGITYAEVRDRVIGIARECRNGTLPGILEIARSIEVSLRAERLGVR